MENVYKVIDEFLEKLNSGNGPQALVGLTSTMKEKALEIILEYKLASFKGDPHNSISPATITEIGKSVIRNGGTEYYVNNKKADVIEKEELEIEKLRYEVKNAKRIFKTYWWTFGFAIAGLTIAIVSFIISVLKWQQ